MIKIFQYHAPPPFRLIAATELIFRDQILVNPLGCQPLAQRRRNLRFPNRASAFAARHRPGGRNGWF